jgi:hypothetical protein
MWLPGYIDSIYGLARFVMIPRLHRSGRSWTAYASYN